MNAMRKLVLALALSTLISAPALADVKQGVDAWARGDYATAIKTWRPLAIAGNADAQFNLGQAYKLGRGVPLDLKQAEEWYRKAALQGHIGAEDNYGLVQFQNGNRQQAMPWIEKSANRGEPRAQYILGTALFNGDMVGKDWVRAYALMTRASASGLAPASSSLAQMDRFIPLDQRQKGLAMARDMEQVAVRPPLPSTPAAPVGPVIRPRPATPTVVRTVDLPPSQAPGATFPATMPRSPAPEPVMTPDPVPAPPPVVVRRPVVRPAPAVVAPAPVPTMAPVRTAGRGWRVQLGAFGQEARARALFDSLVSRVPELDSMQPYLVKAGSITRLQVGTLASEAAADRLCARVKAKGNGCITVNP
jgi:uncharacterized protein